MLLMTNNPGAIQTFKTLESDLTCIHHNKYNYEKALYYNMHTKFIVTCPEHGDFLIAPAGHKNGKGCKECGSIRAATKRRSSTEQFLKKAKIIAPMYDYSKVKYITSDVKVTIVCSIHGDFFITPNKLLSGRRCPHCKGQRIADITTKPYVQFLAEANTLHNNKYTYVETTYVNSKTPMAIVCPEHGVFYQNPDVHLNGRHGCKKCANKLASETNRSNTLEFSNKANIIHKGFYDYSKVDYTTNSSNITIICPIHGPFEQAPANHLAGKGCKICNNFQNYSPLPTTLYYIKLIHPLGEVAYKIGITTKSIQERFRSSAIDGIQIIPIIQYDFLQGQQAYEYEQQVLERYKHLKRPVDKPFLRKGAGDSELFSENILKQALSVPTL